MAAQAWSAQICGICGCYSIAAPSERDSPEAGKSVRMDVYEYGYRDLCVGPQGHPGRKELLLDSTLDALEISVQFVKGELR
jgi:hypothetical protein